MRWIYETEVKGVMFEMFPHVQVIEPRSVRVGDVIVRHVDRERLFLWTVTEVVDVPKGSVGQLLLRVELTNCWSGESAWHPTFGVYGGREGLVDYPRGYFVRVFGDDERALSRDETWLVECGRV